MDFPYPDTWPSLGSILELIVSVFLRGLASINNALRSAGPSAWAGLKWVGHELSVAGNALLAAILVFLLWILIIYICCLAIYIICKLARRCSRRHLWNERQPLLQTASRRRQSRNATNPAADRHRYYDYRAHQHLFRVEMSRRRQDQLRREHTRAIETRVREYRLRRELETNHHHTTARIHEHHDTIVTWLRASSNTNSPPDYGTIAPRATRPPGYAEPPPPYSTIVAEEPPSYSAVRAEASSPHR